MPKQNTPRSTNAARAAQESPSKAPPSGTKRRALEPDAVEAPLKNTPPGLGLVATAPSTALGAWLPSAPKDPASSYLARLAKSSRKTQRHALKKIVAVLGGDGAGLDMRTFPWHQLTYEHARGFLLRMEDENLAHTTVNRHIAALRGVLQEAWRMRMLSADEYMQAIDPLKPVRGQRLAAGRQIEQAEMDALLRVCMEDARAVVEPASSRRGWATTGDGTLPEMSEMSTLKTVRMDVAAAKARVLHRNVYGARDLALFALLSSGLRRHEAVGVLLKDYTGDYATVVGKGNKERVVPLAKPARAFVDAWLKVRPESAAGTIITSPRGGMSLSTSAVDVVLIKRAQQAGIAAESIATHDFRRTFISNMFEAGVDIAIIQKIVGHSDTTTTARYDRRSVAAGKKAVDKMSRMMKEQKST